MNWEKALASILGTPSDEHCLLLMSKRRIKVFLSELPEKER